MCVHRCKYRILIDGQRWFSESPTKLHFLVSHLELDNWVGGGWWVLREGSKQTSP